MPRAAGGRVLMDSVTQIVLGASVGEAVLGRKVGRTAALWGGICGTIPDLDVFIPLGDAVANFTYHRSFSHSVFMLALLTPVVVWLIRRLHPAHARHRLGWSALVYLAFLTHVLLDSCTIYGTQIFWPVDMTPMSWGSVFIIDPAYTLPLVAGTMAVIFMRSQPQRAWSINLAMLALSTLYLAWSFAAKFHAEDLARTALAEQGVEYRDIETLAAPFNTILWRFVVMTGEGYAEGWHSLLDSDRQIVFEHHSSEERLLRGIETSWPVTRLQWFTKGFYRVQRRGDDVVITDLRMGAEGFYAFNFKVGELGNPHTHAVTPELLEDTLDQGMLARLWQRLRGPH